MGSGFGPEDVVNRRVNRHVKELLPVQVSAQKDYLLEGQRWLASETLPGDADRCLCLLKSYVGQRGQFEIHVERVFDRGTDDEWRIENTVTRTGAGSLPPFTYLVTSEIELLGDVETDRTRVSWVALGDDPIYGGREAQAAVLLTEKMSHLRARERGQGMEHSGSLSRLGSLSNVIDTGRQLRTDWEEIDELLGPDADTIAATAGFDALESREQYLEAERLGIDFLAADIEDLQVEGDRREPATSRESDADRPDWQTPPAELTVDETESELRKIQYELRRMKREFDDESPD
ncbi:hypothetical protein HSBGL_2420 [Halapricum desulfuricans]|uniref:Uncharacterized protein n=1 Tax=Halapricum desulfuricans TaxID=2841257 RepID=A0A897NMX0_9EURY|nr:hypothetical protein [Halapricum desulfuricans]QSG12825.1 hypothetical protein HSBGL_2420 [Halapricum desulfuricans]